MTFLLRLLTGLFILTPMLFGGNANADALDWATGFWGLNETDWDVDDYVDRNCKDSPVEISIDRESMSYWSKIGDKKPRKAKISNVTDKSFTLEYSNETRLMADGRPHIWTIRFENSNKFYWIREDWKLKGPSHKTAPRYRCMLQIS